MCPSRLLPVTRQTSPMASELLRVPLAEGVANPEKEHPRGRTLGSGRSGLASVAEFAALLGFAWQGRSLTRYDGWQEGRRTTIMPCCAGG